jgi:predicted phosphodiesterase
MTTAIAWAASFEFKRKTKTPQTNSLQTKRKTKSSIQILSDLHLESPKSYDTFEITPIAPYLALIGDIGCVKDPEYLSFLSQQLSKFKIVFLVPGNHEPFHSSWATTKKKLRQLETENAGEKLGLFVLMDQTRYDISPELTILGCTLFSNILPGQEERVSLGFSDFRYIEDWTVEDHNRAFIADLAWLNARVKSIAEIEPERKIIILTHYSPTTSPETINPAHSESRISSGFSTDLSGEGCWSSRRVKVWVFGHTHFNCDFVESRTGKRVVTNQRGHEAAGFDGEKWVEA